MPRGHWKRPWVAQRCISRKRTDEERTMAILNPAPSWQSRSTDVVLWHGCTSYDVPSLQGGIDPMKGRIDTDFGRGFYTTTISRQARHWAWNRYYDLLYKSRRPGSGPLQPMLVEFRVPRHELASLSCLAFGPGDYDNQDYWSLVQHCRQSGPLGSSAIVNHHFGPRSLCPGDWYDIVCGPVSAFWEQRAAMQSADQVSFHTYDAAVVLNRALGIGPPSFSVHLVQ